MMSSALYRHYRWMDGVQTLPLDGGVQTLPLDGRGADIADGWTGCRHCRWMDGVQT